VEFSMENLYLFGAVFLILILVVLRALTKNRWIKSRLRASIVLFAFSVVISVVIRFQPDWSALPTARMLVTVMALVMTAVVLIFNRFYGIKVSRRYPSIVQDAIVIFGFVIIAISLAPSELLTPSAVGALVVGLALQDTLGNLLFRFQGSY